MQPCSGILSRRLVPLGQGLSWFHLWIFHCLFPHQNPIHSLGSHSYVTSSGKLSVISFVRIQSTASPEHVLWTRRSTEYEMLGRDAPSDVCLRSTSPTEPSAQPRVSSQGVRWMDARKVQTRYSHSGKGGGRTAQRPCAMSSGSCRAEGVPQAGWPLLRLSGGKFGTSRGSRGPKAGQGGAVLWNFPQRECGTTQIFEPGRWSDQCSGKIALTAA